ncbi:MAG TPA: thiol-disulfide oxidoreductase DCC family protein [Virgibacillus sp.]|nr:thiol-disulfide oxidoreductase DCC family protein [Virgibacillus sp.]HLR66945.1 thiol-disulfide oxidoreductase DCC family protein [Virgibacillus sp.]
MVGVLLFDGDCNFCDKSVQFILKRDAKKHFKFASLQSEAGEDLREKFHVPANIDSLLLIENRRFYTKSSAALQVCKHLTGLWKMLYIGILIPKPIRDAVYNVVANNRYTWFGKKNSCRLPTPGEREQFL